MFLLLHRYYDIIGRAEEQKKSRRRPAISKKSDLDLARVGVRTVRLCAEFTMVHNNNNMKTILWNFVAPPIRSHGGGRSPSFSPLTLLLPFSYSSSLLLHHNVLSIRHNQSAPPIFQKS